MNVKKLMTLLVAGAGLAAMANTFYVDANNGDDAYDGLQPTVEAAAKKGPKKTLAEAMSSLVQANRGDVVYVAKGVYAEGNNGRYRVSVPSGCKLIATGSVDETVIVGQDDPGVAADVSPFGCGANSLTCARLTGTAQIVGFTLRGGRGSSAESSSIAGGIAIYEGSPLVIGCVITNCIAGGCAGIQGPNAIRCRFTRNYSCAGGLPNDMRGGTAWNCVFQESDSRRSLYMNYSVMSAKLRNCRATYGLNSCVVYNSHMPGENVNTKFYYSYYYSLGTGSQAVEESSSQSSGNVKVDVDMRPVKGQNIGIDKGSCAYYVEGASAAETPYLDKDFAGGQRVYNGTIDIGAGEYDLRPDIAAALLGGTDERFDLQSASANVGVSGAAAVMAENDEMTWRWDVPEQLDTTYSLAVSVTGSAVLSLYRDGAETPFRTISATDGAITVTYAQLGGSQLRLALAGDGTAAISGVKASKSFYVDANNGDDTYDGLQPTVEAAAKKGPRKTLAAAMELVQDERGDIVYAAKGVYDQGENGIYRVIVKRDCKLIAKGAVEETVIAGQNDSDVAADVKPFGCGPKARACVRLHRNAEVVGFTIRGGRGQSADTGSVSGVYGHEGDSALVVGCVITNCITAGHAGSQSVTAIRCRFTQNYSCGANYQANDMFGGKAWNCTFDLADSRRASYNNFSVMSSTLRNCRVANDVSGCNVYNSHTPSINQNTKYYYSYYYSLGTGSQAVEASASKYGYEVRVDANMRPVKGQNAGIDHGSYAYYTNGASAAVLGYLDKDFAGGQRVYNGMIDIGAGEFDWLSAYAADLGRRVVVEAASPSVVETDAKAVRLVDGGVLALRLSGVPSGAAKLSVQATVAGTGTMTIRVNGEVVATRTAGSAETLFVVADATSDVIAFSFEGDGYADIERVKPSIGFVLLVK